MLKHTPITKQGNSLKKKKALPKRGRLANEWEAYRNQRLVRDRDSEGLIRCQDTVVGLPHCGYKAASPDLHHIVGRDTDPTLYFDDNNCIWLIRSCHDEAHRKRMPNLQ